jgi:hypothetical protein
MFQLPAHSWAELSGVRVMRLPAGPVLEHSVKNSGMCTVKASRWQQACLRKARIKRRRHVTGYLRVYKSMLVNRCITHAG